MKISIKNVSLKKKINIKNVKLGVKKLGVVEDLATELTEQDTLISLQETTIEDIIEKLKGKGIGGITPTGTIDITENGEYDVTNYASANVNIASSGADTTIEDGIIQRTIVSIVNDTATNIGTYAFYKCTKLKEAKFNKVTTVADMAFNASAITTVELPEVTSIGNSVFYSTVVENIYMPKVTRIGHYAFQDTRIGDLVLPNLASIGMDTFKNCRGIKKAYIPNLSSIITQSFLNCTNIEAIIIERTDKLCTMGNVNALSGSGIANGIGYVYVPDNLVDQYKTSTNWSTYASQIKGLSELPEELKEWLKEVA